MGVIILLFEKKQKDFVHFLRPFSSKRAKLERRLVVTLLLMMVVGVSEMLATTIDFNLPNGYYFLGNEAKNNSIPQYDGSSFTANFYMCPAYNATVSDNDYLGSDSGKPLITTFKSFSDNNKNKGKTYLYAIWYIEAATGDNAGYFYIKHNETGQYFVANDNTSPGATRRRVNLGPTTKPEGNDGLFKIQSDDDGNTFYISPKEKHVVDNNGDNKYLCPSNGNKDQLNANSDKSYTGGILGLWTENTLNSAWHFVNAQCSFIYNKAEGSVTISTEIPGATIYYTSGDDPTDPTTSSTNYGTSPITISNVTEKTKFKAIAAVNNNVTTLITSQIIDPEQEIALVGVTSYPYRGTAIEPSVTVTGSDDSVISSDEYNVTYTDNTNAGTATVTITNKPGGSCYVIGGTKNFTIIKAPLTVTAVAHSFTYGDPLTGGNGVTFGEDDGNGGIINGFVNSETSTVLGGTLDYDYSYTLYGDVVGEYTITPKGLTSDNYDFAYVAGALTINQKEVGLTWSETPLAYDGQPQAPTATPTGLVNSDAIGVTVTGSQTNVGTGYTATASELTGEKAGNYKLPTANTTTFAISKAALTVTADNKNIIYGSAAPTYTFSYSGFVNNEDATALTTAPTATCSYTSTSNAGTYDIVPSGGEATNYSFTYENGTLTVAPKTVKDDPDTEAGESAVSIVLTDIPVGNYTYDGTAKTPTVTVKDGETVIASSEYTLGLSDNTNAGTATVNITDNEGGNYNVSGTATFTINPVALTITPDDGQNKQYGDPDPVLTYTTNVGLVEGDELAGALARVGGEDAGSYAITQGTLDNSNNPNYAITVTTGKYFTIDPKSLGNTTDPAENITIEITEANEAHVIVKQGGKLLRAGTEGTDYDYSISTTGDATTKYYEVTITGKNNYTGSFKATFANVTFGTNDNNHYWGTFVSNSSDGDFAVPGNMEAYIVTSINASAGTVEVVPLDNIPEGEPVLLLSTVNANGFIVKTKNDGTDPTVTNLLKVESSAKPVTTAEIYLLYKGEFVLNAEGTLPAGKIYLSKPGGSSAPARLHIVWSQSTGIDNAQRSTLNSQLSGIWYTLDGRRLIGKPTKKGLYLQNGKKMVVR